MQHHLLAVKESHTNMVAKLMHSFEENYKSFFDVNKDKSELVQNCNKEGSVSNVFDLLMLKKRIETRSKPLGERM